MGAGLFTRSLHNLRTVDRGFAPGNVLLANYDPSRLGLSSPQLLSFNQSILQTVSELPGVRAASLAAITPLQGGGMSTPMTVNGVSTRVGRGLLQRHRTTLLRDRRHAVVGGPRSVADRRSQRARGRRRERGVRPHVSRRPAAARAARRVSRRPARDGDCRRRQGCRLRNVARRAAADDLHVVPAVARPADDDRGRCGSADDGCRRLRFVRPCSRRCRPRRCASARSRGRSRTACSRRG